MKKRIFASKIEDIGRKNIPFNMKTGGDIPSGNVRNLDAFFRKNNVDFKLIPQSEKQLRSFYAVEPADNVSEAEFYKTIQEVQSELKEKGFDSEMYSDRTQHGIVYDLMLYPYNFKSGGKLKAGGRISPSDSATMYEVGFRMISDNDGNEWIIQSDKNGRKSWKKYKKELLNPGSDAKKPTTADALKDKLKRKKAIIEIDQEVDDLAWLYKQSTDNEAKSEIRNETIDLDSVKTNIKKADFDLDAAIDEYFSAGKVSVSEVLEDNKFIEDFIEKQAFLDWFGNWMAISVDDDEGKVSEVRYNTQKEGKLGYPILVWHGTTGPFAFNRFDMSKFPVMYFAENYDYANWFAKMGSGIIYPAYLNIRWLFDLRELGIKRVAWSTIWKKAKELGVSLPQTHPTAPSNALLPAWGWLRGDTPHNTLTNAVKKGGYTGMAHVEDNPNDPVNEKPRTTDAFMIFRADQVKVPVRGGSANPYMDIFYMKQGGNIEQAKKSISEKLSKLRKK